MSNDFDDIFGDGFFDDDSSDLLNDSQYSEEDSDDGFNIGDSTASNNSQPLLAESQPNNNEDTKSMAIKVVVAGVAIVILAFLLMKGINTLADSRRGVTNKPAQSQGQVIQNQQVNMNNITGNSSNSWIEITDIGGLRFNDQLMKATFTITDIRHYAKVVDSNKNLVIKTVLTGGLSGFSGTFEIEVPYYKGCQLNKGNYFDVEVQVGELNNKVVIGEIRY